jgi:hypothetical protein
LGVFEVSVERTHFIPLRSRRATWAEAAFAGFILGMLLGGAKRAKG